VMWLLAVYLWQHFVLFQEFLELRITGRVLQNLTAIQMMRILRIGEHAARAVRTAVEKILMTSPATNHGVRRWPGSIGNASPLRKNSREYIWNKTPDLLIYMIPYDGYKCDDRWLTQSLLNSCLNLCS